MRDVQYLPLESKRLICERAKAVCYRWWVDVLDYRVSWCRQRIDMPWNEILAKLTDRCHFTMIKRTVRPEHHLEVCFSTIGETPEYFLWIEVPIDSDLLQEITKPAE